MLNLATQVSAAARAPAPTPALRRCVYLPAIGARVPLRAYIDAVRRAKSLPTVTFKSGLETWWPTVGAEVVDQFRKGMFDRINRHIPGFGQGRRWSQDWQRAALQTAIAVNTPRLVVRWVPVDLRRRLAHRIESD